MAEPVLSKKQLAVGRTMNQFIRAHQQQGTLSAAQQRALDHFLTNAGREQFDAWRLAVGIAPATPNRTLSRKAAWLLIRHITNAIEVGR